MVPLPLPFPLYGMVWQRKENCGGPAIAASLVELLELTTRACVLVVAALVLVGGCSAGELAGSAFFSGGMTPRFFSPSPPLAYHTAKCYCFQ